MSFFADTGDQIVLTPGNFLQPGGLQLRAGKERYYSTAFPEDFLLARGDLLIAMTDLTQGAPLLGAPLVIPLDNRFLHNQRLGKISIKAPDRTCKEFIFHLFCHEAVRAAIRASATGSTVRHTAPTRIYAIEVRLPPLPTQRRIASVLSAYDDLIENNTRRIGVLEEMVRGLHRDSSAPIAVSTRAGWTPSSLGAEVRPRFPYT